MQKSIIIDKALQSPFDELIAAQSKRSKTPLVAFMLGRQTAENFCVAHMSVCRSPLSNEQADVFEHSPDQQKGDKIKGSKPSPQKLKPSDYIDDVWIANEARQLLRSLPGGLAILGLVVVCEKSQRADFHSLLVKALKSIWRLSAKALSPLDLANEAQFVLASIETPMRKPTALVVDFGPRGNSVGTACPIQTAPLRWIQLRARVSLDCPMIVERGDGGTDVSDDGSFHKKFYASNARLRAQVAGSIVAFAGVPRSPVEAVGKQSPLDVELFVPPNPRTLRDLYEGRKSTKADADETAPSATAADVCACDGLLHLKGTMVLRAYVLGSAGGSRAETFGDASRAIKEDFLRSLHSRSALHSDGMSVIEGERDDPISIHQLPRRVLARVGTLDYCDYLFEGDTPDDAAESLTELLGSNSLQVAPADVVDGLERVLNIDELESIDVPLPTITVDGEAAAAANGGRFFAPRSSASSSGRSSPRMSRSSVSSLASAADALARKRRVDEAAAATKDADKVETGRLRRYFGAAVTIALVAMIFYALVGTVV